MNHLAKLSVLVLGLGESGLAMARWCARHGAQVQVWDSRAQPPQAVALREAVPGVALFSGALSAEHLAGVQMVLKSPGLAPHDSRIAPLMDAARATGIAVGGELDLFARALVDLKTDRGYAPKVLAITGTNGKTTTTAMCALLVARCGLRVAAAGNIGPTLLDTLAAALDLEPLTAPPVADAMALVDDTMSANDASAVAVEVPVAAAASELDDEAPLILAPPPAAPVFERLPEVWVLELSSFQLDGVRAFEPSAAAVLNLSQDHLDWHGTMDAYAAAKARIFGASPDSAAVMVVNRDDLRVEAMVPAPILVKGGRGKPSKTIGRKVVRFGLDAPQRPGDFGLVVENGMAWLVRARELDDSSARRKAGRPDEDQALQLQRLMPADALHIRGRHNAANALAALALATAIGCPLNALLHGLRDYHGEPHRVSRPLQPR